MLNATQGLWKRLGDMETKIVADEIDEISISAPIYVTSLARAGTTIVTELINQHPDTTAHKYSDFPWVWTPYWRNYLRQRSQLIKPDLTERAHKDRILVSTESPEAVEEILWNHFFPDTHNPAVSNILDENTSNLKFEEFYSAHLRKLLLVRKSSRYLAKGNYNISRLAYIHKLHPNARFIIPVRSPINHIASLAKQHKFFIDATALSPRVGEQLQLAGHWEFGPGRKAVNYADSEATAAIEGAWSNGDEVVGWAKLWNNTYSHLLNQLAAHPGLAKACYIFQYEDLCLNSEQIISEILNHCSLDTTTFTDGIADFSNKLSLPEYYQPDFSATELAAITTICAGTASKLGYSA